jgi:hypothetical protein
MAASPPLGALAVLSDSSRLTRLGDLKGRGIDA